MADENPVESAAVTAWYAEHADELRAFLTGVLKDRDLAAEVLQTTFSRALDGKHPPRDESPRSWLYQVAFREALAVKRRQKVHARAVSRLAWLRSATTESSESSASRAELAARVREALDELPAEQRQVVRMRVYEDKTFAEIAEETHAPLGTVLTRMRLALKKLESRLGPQV